ncbi:hypothetical protein SUGI_0649480 [Cryptomeria japonica]|nr:hypothetical protein SUGI_0649480 [Cryptomeria japonica]
MRDAAAAVAKELELVCSVEKNDAKVDLTVSLMDFWLVSFQLSMRLCFTGRRNNDLSVQESQHYFPTWAATQIQKGNTMGIVDERIVDKADIEEVRRAAVVSILCIQKDENGRPNMAQVVRMLEGILEGDVERYEGSLQALVDDH